ncbi:MAG: hemin receptor [Prevotella sp.]|nr:hemin receptor [Prevotella sp.]
MKKIFAIAALAMAMLPAAAQETYENAKIAWGDLNGTARYVGMGGAMEALGADISTIGTNPAGIGLFRKSSASLSLGFVNQQDANTFGGGHTTNMSFDQAGIIFTSRNSPSSYINFGFNYHKSRNFDYILSAADRLQNASQNKLSYMKQKNGLLYPTYGNGVPDFNSSYPQCNQLDDIYARNILYDYDNNIWYYENANGYTMDRRHWGYVGDYDFNLSGNINNRVYLGLTIGIHDVHYKHYGEYTETYDVNSPIQVADDRQISGSGADIKAGVIFRPVEYSPFRIGLSVSSPTWYDLTTRNYTTVSDASGTAYANEEYDYKLYTPWKFGVSLGHTIGDYLALGASYEYTDYGSLDSRYKTGRSYSYWYDDYYDASESDDVMNRHTAETLRGVSTFKVGAELKAAPEIAVRLGYNYITPMYQKYGFKDGSLDSDGSYYSSATDYTNWEGTHRITCGLGFQIDKVNLSAAYQYTTQSGNFEPFMSYYDADTAADDNIANVVKVNNKRHQLMLTATYNF